MARYGKRTEHYFASGSDDISAMDGVSTNPWFWVMSWLLTVLTILGNALVLFLVFSRKRLHSIANCFLCSLAAADLCVACLFIPPLFSCEMLPCEHPIVVWYLISYVGHASVCNTMALAFDRYTAIVFPILYNYKMSKRRIVVTIMMTWLAPLVFDTIPSIALPRAWSSGEEIAQVTSMIIFQILPCIVLPIATRKLVKVARKHSLRTKVVLRQLRFNQPNHPGKPERSSARLIHALVVVFMICYTAQALSSLCSSFTVCLEFQPDKAVRYTLALLLLANSAANPIVYAFLKRDVKRELMRIFRAGKRCEG